jgi:hypothetical protein
MSPCVQMFRSGEVDRLVGYMWVLEFLTGQCPNSLVKYHATVKEREYLVSLNALVEVANHVMIMVAERPR